MGHSEPSWKMELENEFILMQKFLDVCICGKHIIKKAVYRSQIFCTKINFYNSIFLYIFGSALI